METGKAKRKKKREMKKKENSVTYTKWGEFCLRKWV
jgi:hypothetical protein